MSHGQKSRFFGDKLIPPLIGNPYNWYIKPYYWVDDHPLLYGNNGRLDPSTHNIKGEDVDAMMLLSDVLLFARCVFV